MEPNCAMIVNVVSVSMFEVVAKPTRCRRRRYRTEHLAHVRRSVANCHGIHRIASHRVAVGTVIPHLGRSGIATMFASQLAHWSTPYRRRSCDSQAVMLSTL
jgi:hypothetical protein